MGRRNEVLAEIVNDLEPVDQLSAIAITGSTTEGEKCALQTEGIAMLSTEKL